MPTPAGHTICLREDGSQELEESAFLSLREPDETPPVTAIGGGRVPEYFDIVAWKRNQEYARLAEIHNAAVRLGTIGGIASGKSRRQ